MKWYYWIPFAGYVFAAKEQNGLPAYYVLYQSALLIGAVSLLFI